MTTLTDTTVRPAPAPSTAPAPAAQPATAARRRTRTVRRWVADVVWTLLAVVGLASVGLFAGVASGSLSSMVVISGSMTPTYHVGDGLISQRVSADRVDVGDVVSVWTPDGVLVTHRIVAIEEGPSAARTLTLRGDANPTNDPYEYVVTDVLVPRVVVPHAGTIVDLARTPTVAVPVVVAACALLAYALLPGSRRRSRGDGSGG